MSLPYFPMFPTDFEAKTSHLTLAEDGAYNRLLRLMWMTPGCSLPADDAWLMRRMRVDQATFDTVVRVVLDEFFTVENGRLSNAKLSRIFRETTEAHQKRVSAGSKGGKSKSLKTNKSGSSNAKAMPKQPEPEPEPLLRGTNVPLSSGDDVPAPPALDLDACFSAYNAAAERVGWPQCQARNPKRKAALRARIKDCGGVEQFTEAIQRAARSSFLTGQTDRSFFASIDWLTNSSNFTKLMEGNYDNRDHRTGTGSGMAHQQGTARGGQGSSFTDALLRRGGELDGARPLRVIN